MGPGLEEAWWASWQTPASCGALREGGEGCKAKARRGGLVKDGGRPRSVQDFASYLQARCRTRPEWTPAGWLGY